MSLNIPYRKRLRTIFTLAIILVLMNTFASAHGEYEFDIAEQYIKDKVPCSELNEDQLEMIGEYYMEQMHPGELHEIMDERMGGEGSPQLKQAHVAMARSFYCGEHGMISAGMMNTMMGRTGMMGGGMMGRYTGFYTGFGAWFWWLFSLLFSVGVILLVYLWIFKLWRQIAKSK